MKYVCESFDYIINEINIIINSITDNQNLEMNFFPGHLDSHSGNHLMLTTDDSNNTHTKLYLFGYGKIIFTKLKTLYIKSFLKSSDMCVQPHKYNKCVSCQQHKYNKHVRQIINKYESLNLSDEMYVYVYEDNYELYHLILMMLDKYKNIYKSHSDTHLYYCVLIPNYDLDNMHIEDLLENIQLKYFDSIYDSNMYIKNLIQKYDNPDMKVSNLCIYNDMLNPYEGKYTQIEFSVDGKLVSKLIYFFNDYTESYVNNYYNR